MSKESEKLISAGAAAKILSISPATLHRWRIEGFGPDYYRVGKLVKYEEQAVRNWLHDRHTKMG